MRLYLSNLMIARFITDYRSSKNKRRLKYIDRLFGSMEPLKRIKYAYGHVKVSAGTNLVSKNIFFSLLLLLLSPCKENDKISFEEDEPHHNQKWFY